VIQSPTYTRVITVVLTLASCVFASPCLGQATEELRWDDGAPDGKRSTAQAGYTALFEAPEGKPVLHSVKIHAGQYGPQNPPARDFTLIVHDQDLRPVAVFGIPYDVLERADPSWQEIVLPEEVRPPAQFGITLFCHCLQTRGVYMSWDACAADKCLSYSMAPDLQYTALAMDNRPANWMMRCVMAEEFVGPDEANPAIYLRHGDGVWEDRQSMGGAGQIVEFETPDDGTYVVDRVLVSAGFYGRPDDGQGNMIEVSICGPAGLAVASKTFLYSEFYRSSSPSWASLPMDEDIQVSGTFYVVTNMNSRQTPGVYVGYDSDGDGDYSQLGTPGNMAEWKPPKGDQATTNWCIDCAIRKAE